MEARPGQCQFALVRQAQHRLHRSLAEGIGADHDGLAAVLQGCRHDLRSRGRIPIDQNDDRQLADQVVAPGLEVLMALGMAAVGRDDPAVRDEEVGDRHGLIQQTAGIVAQVDDEAAQVLADLPLRPEDLLPHGLGGRLIEARDPDHRHVVEAAVADRLRDDVIALDVDLEGLGQIAAPDADPDVGSDGAAQGADHVPLLHPGGEPAGDADNQILVLQAGRLGWRFFHDGDQTHAFLLDTDPDADAAEAVAAGPVLPRLLAPGVAGVGVQLRHHAVEDRLVDILGPGFAQCGREAPSFLDGARRRFRPASAVAWRGGGQAAARRLVVADGDSAVLQVETQLRIDQRHGLQTGHRQIVDRYILDVDGCYVLVAGDEHPFGAGGVIGRRLTTKLLGRAGAQCHQRDAGGGEGDGEVAKRHGIPAVKAACYSKHKGMKPIKSNASYASSVPGRSRKNRVIGSIYRFSLPRCLHSDKRTPAFRDYRLRDVNESLPLWR